MDKPGLESYAPGARPGVDKKILAPGPGPGLKFESHPEAGQIFQTPARTRTQI